MWLNVTFKLTLKLQKAVILINMSAARLKVKMWCGCYVNVTQKGCSDSEKFREGLFESDEAAFMSTLFFVYNHYWGNHCVSAVPKVPPTGRERICIFNEPICCFCSDPVIQAWTRPWCSKFTWSSICCEF